MRLYCLKCDTVDRGMLCIKLITKKAFSHMTESLDTSFYLVIILFLDALWVPTHYMKVLSFHQSQGHWKLNWLEKRTLQVTNVYFILRHAPFKYKDI